MNTDAAVAEAFRSHAGLVERVLRRAGVPERDLNDVRQEVFIVVHRRLAEFEGRSSLSTWLYRIAVHVASDHRRRAYQRRERLAERDGAAVADPHDPAALPSARGAASDPLQRCEQRELVEHALRALQTLEPGQREAFVLSELYELPMREVAARLGCPQKTAFSRSYAARRRILAELQRIGALQLLPGLIPLRALRSLQLQGAAPAALLPALLPFAAASALVAAALLLAWPASAPRHGATAVPAALPARAAQAAPPAAPELRAAGTAAPRSANASELASADGRAVPVAPAPASPRRAPRRPAPALAVAVPAAADAPVSAAPSPAPEPDDMTVVRAGALDVRPTIDNPLAPPAVPAPARIRLRGPRDPADGVERALDPDPLFAYPIADR